MMRKGLRHTVGTSAAVVLAAVVNAAVATPAVAQSLRADAPHQAPLAGDLSWAISGATASAQSTRSLLAVKAAQAIHSLDRICGAENTPYIVVSVAVEPVCESACVFRPAFIHTDSTHQHSAP